MEDIQIFIVFHKHIFDDCYKKIPNDILYKYFTFIAVNKTIVKTYTPDRYKVINEWELPIYDNSFQERGYNENSAIYHVYANKLHKNYKYIGFFQYDMIFIDNIIDVLKKTMNDTPTYFCYGHHNFNLCYRTIWDDNQETVNFIIDDYEKFYNKPFSRNSLYPLWNSYIIPNEIYENTMKWVVQLYDKMYPWCIQYPKKTHFIHIGEIFERVMAYAIGNEKLRSIKINIIHNHNYKKLSY
jgi:hypothetical protein